MLQKQEQKEKEKETEARFLMNSIIIKYQPYT